ncbi:ABC-type amino acid transport substrate-binding protein [Desulfitispora alkaliphila]|uniref:transporter substrate-binding domain-containing protein n=1 Tax=Desulfitispora alkaliphila TaxID=622674 RepID=UPI003D1A6006
MKKKLILLVAIMMLGVVALAGCGDENGVAENGDAVEEETAVLAVVTGTTFEEFARGYSKVSDVRLYDDDNLTMSELNTGRVDGVITDRLVGLNAIEGLGFDSIQPVGDWLYEETIAVAISKDDVTLRQAINAALAEIIEEGTYAEISNKYFGEDILEGVDYQITFPDEEPATDDSLERVLEAGEIRFAMSGGYPPFNYYVGEELTGFDVEIGQAVAEKLGVEYEPVPTGDFGGLIEELRSGRVDGIFGSMAITEERLEQVSFTDPYYYSGAQLFVQEGSWITAPEDLE